MVATTFADKGQSSQRSRGRGTSSGQPRGSTAPALAPSAPRVLRRILRYVMLRPSRCFRKVLSHQPELQICQQP
jgi:hypothetical protein